MNSNPFDRREFLKIAGAGATLSALGACAVALSALHQLRRMRRGGR